MTTTGLVPAAAVRVSAETSAPALGEAIAALAAGIHAATFKLLVMLREFDALAGWNTGFLSCARWLHWRTGFDVGACREKVRVARALTELPLISAEMQRGRLSYAKVRALTRVATPATERQLLDVALAGTAAQVERVVRAWRRVDRSEAARETQKRHLGRELATWVDDDGMVVIRGRLTPELGAVVQRALEAAADRLFHDAPAAPAGESAVDEITPAQRRADALGLLAEAALADLDRGTSGDRYQVVLHVESGDAARFDGALETDHGGVYVSGETSRRLSCDGSVVKMVHDGSGAVLEVGRKTRTIPPSIRRALSARDRTCRFPGCTARRCDAHHIEHWADGGQTSLGNLLLLCRRHHRLVHEERFAVMQHGDGAIAFFRPDGSCLEAAPQLPATVADPLYERVADGIPVWDGTPFDLAWAINVLRPLSHVTAVT